tara:strand:+ start:1555 stop:5097 length:3543 start_codon:yes stop_codon:yes gene_type:complete
MAFKQINLNGGLNLQDSELKKGFNEFSDLQNLRHENGSLVKRHGTGAPTTISANTSCIINNAGIFVHRKLTGVRIDDTNNNNITFNASAKTMTLQNTTGLVIPTGGTDLTTVFKAGDVITISTSEENTPTNINKALTIASVAATQITFTTTLEDDTLNNSTDCQITFVFDRLDDGNTPNNLQINDANSFDGRALIVTYADGTNMEIGMLNANDYGDLETIATILNASDMHIRMKTYTDGVRFACGLDHAPLLFKYVNRQHFNGMLTHDYNSDAHTMYPTWFMDTAVPIEQANTYTVNSVSSPEFISGSLDLLNNVYDYKFIPLYDGVQEALLDNAVINESSSLVSNRNVEKNGILTLERSAFKLTGKIDTQNFNPRTSGLNVYRSTNGGTYYKIKTIYMGDNDPNQKQLDLYGAKDILFFKGNTAPVAATFNSTDLIVDGFRYQPKDGGTTPDFDNTGYNLVDTDTGTGFASNFNYAIRNDKNMGYDYYGSKFMVKFNHKSEDTETIFADNGECTGGSANGGWYFAGSEIIDTINNAADYDPNTSDESIDLVTNDSSTPGPFAAPFSASNSGNGSYVPHLKFTHDGSPNEDMRRFNLGGTNPVSGGTEYIISGWIRADGFNRADASWRLFVHDTALPTDSSGDISAMQDIAQGRGGENQNIDKWRWFQYTITPSSTNIYMYMYMNVIGDIWDNSAFGVYVKALSVRPSVSNFTLNDNCTAFLGKQIGMSSHLSDLGLPNGVLKGNSIQEHDNNPVKNYPTNLSADRAEIVDNFDSFLRSDIVLPDVGFTDSDGPPEEDTFLFGTSNYQFYSNGTGTSAATDRYVLFDFYDPGLPDGARHPNEGITSLDVKFKYATMLNGRQFVANVKITGDEDTEEYPNFVMFSNPGSPDSIPTSNFIKLDDLQGGEIVGIETLMSDIVVFMTKGIFRINVPSGDPTNWSLVEAHPNIGCLNDKAIAKAPNGIYFCSQDGIVYLDSGFSANIISNPIKDTYQLQALANPLLLRLHYEAKNNRIRLLYSNASGGSNTLFYLYDISRSLWTNELHTNLVLDEMSIDNNNNTILIESASSSKIRVLEDTSSNQDGGSVPINIIMKTGFEQVSSFDQNSLLRRINTKVDAASTGADLAVFFNESGSASYSNGNYLNGMQSTRAFTGNRGKSIQVRIEDNTNQDLKIEKIELEYE